MIELIVVLGVIIALAAVVLTVLDPQLQRNRAHDAVLRKHMGDIGLAMQSYYGIRGYYPAIGTEPALQDQLAQFRQMLGPEIGFGNINAGTRTMQITHPSVQTGSADNYIELYSCPTDDSSCGGEPPCLQAATNESSSVYFVWFPGQEIKEVDSLGVDAANELCLIP